MLSLGRVNRALDFVRSGKVAVDGRALNRLLNIYIDAHVTESFDNNDVYLIEQIEAKGVKHGQNFGRGSIAGSC
jgi:hypothetical protein